MTTATPPLAPLVATDVSALVDTDLCTVLYNYGTPAADSVQRLGGIEGIVTFKSGVARNVPYRVAKAWREGVTADGKKIAGAPKVHILPNAATEAEYAQACGLSAEAVSPQRTAAALKGMSVGQLIDLLGPDDARLLADAVYDALGLHHSTAFAGSTKKQR